MVQVQKLAILLVMAVASVTEQDRISDDLCNVCLCSADEIDVDCYRAGLTDIPDSSSIQDKVQKLNLSNNEFTIFPERLDRFASLTILDISGNQISAVPENALQNLTKLEFLNLSRNNFDSWVSLNPNVILTFAPALKLLDLCHNKFTSMGNLQNSELFISASVETVNLEGCDISTIQGKSVLSGLINIRSLKLSYNPIRRLQGLVSSTLKHLEVSHCQLSHIHPESLIYLPSLVYLQMSHNYRLVLSSGKETLISDSLRYLDVSFCNIMQPNVGGFPNLRKLVASRNMIRSLASHEFVNNTKLEYLDLSYNSIGSLRVDTFRGLTNLRYLDLSWNEIASIPEDTFVETPVISQLILSRNYLTSVGYLKSKSISLLDMSQCEISYIGRDSLDNLQSLIDLNLSRNLLTYIPDSISSDTLQFLNLNYNRIGAINNFTFFMMPRLKSLMITGNRFTTIWNKAFFQSNPYIERLDLSDNMWRCDCEDSNMYDFYEFLTLEPGKKEESHNLVCHSPNDVNGRSWIEACFYVWYPSDAPVTTNNLAWFLIAMIVGLSFVFLVVTCVRNSMRRRLAAMQVERERQVEEARDRLRQLRMRAEQEALCNAPDPRDLISPPSYDEALSMPKLNTSSYSLNETGSGKSRRKRGRRKTKSSGDLLDETNRDGDIPLEQLEFNDSPESESRKQRRSRRKKSFGSHEITDLENSPGSRRRRALENHTSEVQIFTAEIEAELELPHRLRRNSTHGEDPRESDL